MGAKKRGHVAPASPLPSLTDLLERTGDAFVALDTHWRYVYVNTKAAQIFGRKPKDLLGKHIWTEFPEGIDQPFYRAYHKAVETQTPLSLEEYYPPYDRWFENRIFPSKDGLVIFFQDITERKRIEASIARSNRSLAMHGASGEALMHSDDEPTLLREICRICVEVGGYRMAWVGYAENGEDKAVRIVASFGCDEGYLKSLRVTWSETELGKGPTGTAIRTGRPQMSRNIPEDPLFAPWRDAAKKCGYRSSIALPLISENRVFGALNIYSVEANAFSSEETEWLLKLANDLAFGVAALRTRTHHALVERQLRESESRYRMLFEQNPAPMLIYARDTLSILSVNEAFLGHYGYSKDEIMAMRLPDLYPEEEKEKIAALIPTLRGYQNVGEWHHRKRDGSLMTIVACSHDLRFRDRIARVAVITDISDRKLAEEKVRSLNIELERRVIERTAQLESANRELESFSYSVSHDLRAPLRAISGFAEIIARRYSKDLTQEGRHYFDNIIQAGERMGRLIDDLLTYSRLGRRSLMPVPIKLDEVLRHIAKDFAPRLAETGGTLVVAPDLPGVLADRSLLDQIFTNLIQNALTYHRPGVPPRVGIEWRSDGSDIVVSVSDNGIGIAAEYFEKIFNVFQRLHSDDEYPGTGIGLSTVRKAAELVGGKVWLESEVGKGSTFFIKLPKE